MRITFVAEVMGESLPLILAVVESVVIDKTEGTVTLMFDDGNPETFRLGPGPIEVDEWPA